MDNICHEGGCQSTRWTDNRDGTETCGNGHTRPRYSRGDEEEYHVFGETSRRKTEKIKRVPLVPKGKTQTNLLLLAHQHILWLQVWWFVNEKNFPHDFEVLVQELWAQRVNVLADKIDDTAITTFQTSMPVSDTEDEKQQEQQGPIISFYQLPNIDQTLALCYLAAYLMRIPIFIGDIMRWVTQKMLPYVGSLHLLPAEMRSRIGRPTRAFIKNPPISVRRLQQRTHALMMAYQQVLGLTIPQINLPLCLYRTIEWLALPLDVYLVVKNMAAMLSYSFDYPDKSMRAWARETPDKKLAAMVVVAVKLLYPFDAVNRHPSTNQEPGAIVLDWEAWRSARRTRDNQIEGENLMTREQAQAMTENKILQLPKAQVDQYMEWFRDEWADKGEETTLLPRRFAQESFAYEEAMFRMYPVDKLNTKTTLASHDEAKEVLLENLRQIQGCLTLRSAIVADQQPRSYSVKRPGHRYLRHRTIDAMSEAEREFHEAIAAFIGLTPVQLIDFTGSIEYSLDEWIRVDKREAKTP